MRGPLGDPTSDEFQDGRGRPVGISCPVLVAARPTFSLLKRSKTVNLIARVVLIVALNTATPLPFAVAGPADKFGDPGPVAPPAEVSGPGMENNTDRPGSDYDRVLTKGGPDTCQASCKGDPNCRAWTLVRHGVQDFYGVCYYKNPAPPAVANNCCVSGVIPRKRGPTVREHRPVSP